MAVSTEDWLLDYRQNIENYRLAADVVKEQIEDVLGSRSFSVHLVEARAKSPDAVAEKIRRKNYRSPKRSVTDLIGVRVILLFEHSVPSVVSLLRDRFEYDRRRSVDKTAELGVKQVGYRSNHLLIKPRPSSLVPDVNRILKTTFVEVQVRSVISHAWAEIEHSLRYKVGGGVKNDLARRFDALAGTLELVDREFTAIELATVDLVEEKIKRYGDSHDLDDGLTSLNLMAALRVKRPQMVVLGPDGLLLPIEDAYKLSKLLEEAGVRTVGGLLEALEDRTVREKVRLYAELAAQNILPEQASGLVVLGVVIGVRKISVFQRVDLFTGDQILVNAVNG